MTTQPDALQLADAYAEACADAAQLGEGNPQIARDALEAELRRLHAGVEEQCRLNAMGQEREARLMAQRDELLRALRDAAFCIQDWGSYASEYFRNKHDLNGDVERVEAAIAKAEGRA